MKKNKQYQKISRIPLKYIPIMILASLSINVLSLALPLVMKQIYSRVVIYKSKETLIILIIGCVVALILEAILRKTKETSSKWIAAKYENQLSNYLINKILNSYDDVELAHYNASLDKFNSISTITTYFSTRFYQLFIDLPFAFLFLVIIYIIGGNLVFVPVILALIYIIMMAINTRKYSKSRVLQINANDDLVSQVTETLEKIHLIKAAGLEEFQIIKYRKMLKTMTELEFKSKKYQMNPDVISPYLSQGTLFMILIYGGSLMITGNLSFGDITACALLGGRAIAPVQSLMAQYLQHKDIKILNERLNVIAKKEDCYDELMPEFPSDISGSLELINLQYLNVQNNDLEVLSLHINPGSFVHISPQTFYSYKKMMYKIIGKESITSGKILIDNLDITEWNISTLKGKIEYLSDQVSLFKGSILDNITYFNSSKNHNAYVAASLTGLDELIIQMSEGFETILDSQATNYLSVAFMQRLNLTRALVDRPRILLLDCIDECMDAQTLEIFKWLLIQLKGKVTIIIATNNTDIEGMSDCDFIELISKDRLN